jgi:hypothetical protein
LIGKAVTMLHAALSGEVARPPRGMRVAMSGSVALPDWWAIASCASSLDAN